MGCPELGARQEAQDLRAQAAQQHTLLRALAQGFVERMESRKLDTPERNAGLAVWNAAQSGHDLTPLGHAALATTQETEE